MDDAQYTKILEYIHALAQKCVALEQRVQALQNLLEGSDRLFEWIRFRTSSEYSNMVGYLRELGFPKGRIEKAIMMSYDPKLSYDDLIKRVTLQLSTNELFRG